MLPLKEKAGGPSAEKRSGGVVTGPESGYNNQLWLFPLCKIQNGYCLAIAFNRSSVSSSG